MLDTKVERNRRKFKLGLFHKLYQGFTNTTNLFRMVGYAYHTRQVLIATDVMPRKFDNMCYLHDVMLKLRAE